MTKDFRQITHGLMIIGCGALSGCYAPYSAKSIEAKVVDATTNEPLEGVIVVAQWVLKFGIEGAGSEDLVAMETATGSDGRFRLRSWGPKLVPLGLPFAALQHEDPGITLFKSGYMPRRVYNSDRFKPYSGWGPLIRSSQWDGKSIPLERFEGPPEEYALYVGATTVVLELTECRWKKIPRLLAALDGETKRLRSQGVRAHGTTIEDLVRIADGEGCGSVEEFFKEYVQ